ncbi:MAG: nucleoside monophosphate kinase [Candidatus Paceibacterota bacterium]
MEKQVVIFFGPPGAGKGTQADMIAEKFGFAHVETSKIIETRFKNADPDDPDMQKEKKTWIEGGLTTPTLFAGWFNEEMRELAEKGRGVVTSGSLRTVVESEIVLPVLEELYGKDNIRVFYITLSEEESIKRNSNRRICQGSRHPIPSGDYDARFKDITVCPRDGSPIITRALDKPEIIKERYRVFWKETAPVLDYLKDRGYSPIEIDGGQKIEKVTEDILKYFKDDSS